MPFYFDPNAGPISLENIIAEFLTPRNRSGAGSSESANTGSSKGCPLNEKMSSFVDPNAGPITFENILAEFLTPRNRPQSEGQTQNQPKPGTSSQKEEEEGHRSAETPFDAFNGLANFGAIGNVVNEFLKNFENAQRQSAKGNEEHHNEVKTINKPEKFVVSFDVDGYKAEELHLNLAERTLTIEGEHQGEDGTGSVKRTFSRKYTFPQDLDLTEMKSFVKNSKLIIEVPKNSAKPIPIEINVVESNSKEKRTPTTAPSNNIVDNNVE